MIAVFLVGVIETFVGVALTLSIVKHKVWVSTLLEFLYSCIYLFIVAYALRNADTVKILLSYAGGCAVGTHLRLRYEKPNIKGKHNVK